MPLLSRLPRARSLLFLALLLTAIAAPIPPAAAQTLSQPAFEVASVRPSPPSTDPNSGHWSIPGNGSFSAVDVSLTRLLMLAYNLDASQIANKPAWLDGNLYDIDAKPEPGVQLSREELRPRLQALLQQRFHLVAHMETRPTRGYALVVAKAGPHLTPTKGEHFPGWRIHVGNGDMRGENWSMPQLAQYLTQAAGFPVVDQTHLTASYDISFSYNPNPDTPGNDSTLPPLSAALEQATGLILKPAKVPVATLVIDSADPIPTAN